MSEEMKALRDNTDRRFAILMTTLQDFMTAFQQERNRVSALLDIEEKVEKAPKKKTTFTAQEKKRPPEDDKP
jgi:hypothetical protein